MQSKSLLIAIAAFAVTATGAQAFVGTQNYSQLGLSTQQVQAFTQARDLRRKGEVEKARDVLLEAGVTEDTLATLRSATHGPHQAVHEAVLANDFEAFKLAIVGTPLADIVTTEADFAEFKKAHDLKTLGKMSEAKVILDELGVPHKGMGRHHQKMHGLKDLSEEERDALLVARQANDTETMKAILIEAGVTEERIEKMITKRTWRGE